MCDWVTLLCSRKLIEHCKPTIMEKKKPQKKALLDVKKKKKREKCAVHHDEIRCKVPKNEPFKRNVLNL